VSRSRPDAAPSFLLVRELGTPGDTLSLDDENGHYVTRVCRARVGETLSATNGRGESAGLTILSLEPRVVVRLDSVRAETADREAIVWCGTPEGSRADWLVEKLGELGVATFQPIDCARSRWNLGEARLGRLRRLAEAALRQSRRSRLMRIEPSRPLEDLARAVPAGISRWLADPAGARNALPASKATSIVAVGPAEGFDGAEVALLEALEFQSISLSDGRLRTETAAISWAAWWSSRPSR